MTYVDDFGETFSRHWKTGDWTYKTSDKTAFRLGCKKAAFSDLKVGEMDETGGVTSAAPASWPACPTACPGHPRCPTA